MIFKAKLFGELTAAEIYEILKARSRVFQLEQNIRYLDEDDTDYDSLHCFFEENGQVKAYLRAFSDNGKIRFGRVLTVTHGQGHGKMLMERSVKAARERFGEYAVIMDAQKHAEGFYKKLGFVTTSGEFLEEGIVHVAMELPCEETIDRKDNTMNYKITDCTDSDIDSIYSGLTESNCRKVPELQNGRYYEINKKIADENGRVIAGCTAEVNHWNALHIDALWVSEEYRKCGLGSGLLKEVEKIAAESGCTLAHLSTFDFQAKDFYIKQGYEVFGTLENCPEGHCRYYLKKVIK